jgi:resuscitation-promoting factor RpfB
MMKLTIRSAYLFRYLIVGAVVLCALLVSALYGLRALADDGTVKAGQHFISIHDRGVEKGIVSSASTLRHAFKEAGIEIGNNDLVEPGLDEQLVASSYQVNIYRARPVVVVDGVSTYKVLTPHQTSKQIAEDAGVTLHDEDITEVGPVSDMATYGAGLQVSIDRATPFTLVLYGERIQAFTQEQTVGDMLKDKSITLNADDTLSVDRAAGVSGGMTIEIWRNGKQTVSEEQAIDFPTEKVQDADREVGYREVRTPGEKGKKTVTYEVIMKNGVEESRHEIQSVVTQEPKKQVEVVGSKMTNTFSGSFAEALARLRSCESGGAYNRNSGNGYYGAYQYDVSTWANTGGFTYASDAPASVQDEKVWETYKRRGWAPWPSCKNKMGLQDIYR